MSIYSSSPINLQLHPILFKYLNSLKTITFFFSLSKAKIHYILARPCQSIAVYFIFHILTIPYILSLVDHYYIYFIFSPFKAIKGIKGIYLLF